MQNIVSNVDVRFQLYLKRNGIEFDAECLVEYFVVDLFIKPNIVIEIVGRHHFFEGKLDRTTIIRKQILEHLGYAVIIVEDKFMRLNSNKQ